MLQALHKLKQQQAQGIDTNAQAFITAVGTLSSTEQTAINNLVVKLKSDGIWSKFYALYPLVSNTAAEHKWNLKDPQDTNSAFRLTFTGTITHNSLGIKSDGTTGWANTHLFPSTTMSLTSQSMHVSIVGNSTQVKTDCHDIGSYNGSSQNMYIQSKHDNTNNELIVRMNAGASTYANANADGNYSITRGSGNVFHYKNGVVLGNVAHTGTLPTRNVALCNTGFGTTGVYSEGYSTQVIGFAALGQHLSGTEVSNFHTAINNYFTEISR